MAGYVPGQLPLNRSQEKEFVQAYEDVLERYKVTSICRRAGKLPRSKLTSSHHPEIRNSAYSSARDRHAGE